MMDLNQLQYGRDQTYNQTLNDRALQAYNSRNQQQTMDWNRWASMAGYGTQAAQQLQAGGQANANQVSSLLGQLGTAQGMGTLGQAGQWNQAIAGGVSSLQNLLRGLNT